MPKYKPNYEDLNKISDEITLTGKTSKECVSIEESAQKDIAESPEWILARKLNWVRGEYYSGKDSQLELESLGFKMLGKKDDFFYKVLPPKGWEKKTKGYWTTVRDNEGKERMIQFFKGAFYDMDAFLNIN